MRVATIDLGTNSVRFDIYDVLDGRVHERLFREKLMVRLGEGVFIHHKLSTQAARRTIQALVHFRRVMDEFYVDETIAFATSALRTAKDSGSFLRKIKSRTGIPIEIISGEQEARLIAEGILAYEKGLGHTNILVDIGGGSTEVSFCSESEIFHAQSFDLGTARLQEIFLKSSPPPSQDSRGRSPVLELQNHVRQTLKSIPKKFRSRGHRKLIGSSGTIKVLSRILSDSPNKRSLGASLSDLKKLNLMMQVMTPQELIDLPGIESKRVDMILAGSLLLQEIGRAHV